ncbi:hypothetical protein [Pseudomonas sp. yb_9]|uniref:hypothetical protein n=1 Tax=Pseudomonas sp. yb_9 TaxID=3367222 RepID=UPI00370C7963
MAKIDLPWPPALLKYQHLFGKRPVADIAKLAGVSAYFVIKRMKQLGKPTFKRSAITNFDHLQGTMCDQALRIEPLWKAMI